jgi:hypothetical protein
MSIDTIDIIKIEFFLDIFINYIIFHHHYFPEFVFEDLEKCYHNHFLSMLPNKDLLYKGLTMKQELT